MAVRLRTQFHIQGPRSQATLASVAAILAWKLAVEAIRRMRGAGYDIDIGRPYFEFVCEFMVFMAVSADRIAYRELDEPARVEFTSALAKRLAEIVEDNRDMLLGVAGEGESGRHFLALFNRRGAEYAEFDYGDQGPDFGFKRFFAACLREGLPAKDKLWVVDQVMEIEAPEALKALEKTLAGMFHPEREKGRRARGVTQGE